MFQGGICPGTSFWQRRVWERTAWRRKTIFLRWKSSFIHHHYHSPAKIIPNVTFIITVTTCECCKYQCLSSSPDSRNQRDDWTIHCLRCQGNVFKSCPPTLGPEDIENEANVSILYAKLRIWTNIRNNVQESNTVSQGCLDPSDHSVN